MGKNMDDYDYDDDGGIGVGALIGLGLGIFVVGSLVVALSVIGLGELMDWGPSPRAALPSAPTPAESDQTVPAPLTQPDSTAGSTASLFEMWSMWCTSTPAETEDAVTRYTSDAWLCNGRDGEELHLYRFASLTNASSALQALANRYGDPGATRLGEHPIVCGTDFLIGAERVATAQGIEDALRGHDVSIANCSL